MSEQAEKPNSPKKSGFVVKRVVMAAPVVLLGIAVIFNPPWLTAWHQYDYGFGPYFPTAAIVSGFCILVAPGRICLAIVGVLAPFVLGAIWLSAWLHWVPGNDGGGFFWILVIAPGIAITTIVELVAAISLSSDNPSQATPESRQEQLERKP